MSNIRSTIRTAQHATCNVPHVIVIIGCDAKGYLRAYMCTVLAARANIAPPLYLNNSFVIGVNCECVLPKKRTNDQCMSMNSF